MRFVRRPCVQQLRARFPKSERLFKSHAFKPEQLVEWVRDGKILCYELVDGESVGYLLIYASRAKQILHVWGLYSDHAGWEHHVMPWLHSRADQWGCSTLELQSIRRGWQKKLPTLGWKHVNTTERWAQEVTHG